MSHGRDGHLFYTLKAISYHEADLKIKSLSATNKEKADLYRWLTVTYFGKHEKDKQEQDYHCALDALDKAMTLNTHCIDYLLSGRAFLLHANFSKALEALICYYQADEVNKYEGQQLLKDHIENIFVYLNDMLDESARLRDYMAWGKCFFYLEIFEPSLQCMQQIIRFNPQHEEALLFCAQNYIQLNSRKEGTDFFNRLLNELKATDFLYYCKGLVNYSLRNAMKDFSEAIERNPNDERYYYELGKLNANYPVLNFDAAIQNFSDAIKINPKAPIYFNQRGHAYAKLNQHYLAACDFLNEMNLKQLDIKNDYRSYQKLFDLIEKERTLAPIQSIEKQLYHAVTQEISLELERLGSKENIFTNNKVTIFSPMNPQSITSNNASLKTKLTNMINSIFKMS